ncbi:hypothetical protein Tco_1364968 [Tanacetum coccineum]
MAALKYRDEHNRIGFLEKPKGSTDYHQVIDFLLNSHIRYAIVTDPLIYDSLITQFWSTASLRSSELGPPAIVATIDGTPYTITESLVRSQLQLHDEGGIVDMPIPDIFLGMDNLGYPTEGKLTFHKNKFSPQWRFLIHTLLHCLSTKSGSWDQFGSPLAIALICLCEGKKYNWSCYIFTGMVNNINNSKKFLMFPRFLQMILDIETRNTKPYHAFRLTSKMFANMRLNFHGDHMPLVAAMLPPPQAAIAAGTSKEVAQANPQTAYEPVTDSMHPTASSHDHGSTSPRPTPTTPGPSSDPHVESSSKDNDSNPDPNVADDPLGGSFFASPSRSTAAPPEGTTSGGAEDLLTLTALYTLVSEQGKKIGSLESELQAHKLLFKDVMGKLVKRVKFLESKLKARGRNVILSESDNEEDKEQEVDLVIKLAKAAAFASDTSSVPVDGQLKQRMVALIAERRRKFEAQRRSLKRPGADVEQPESKKSKSSAALQTPVPAASHQSSAGVTTNVHQSPFVDTPPASPPHSPKASSYPDATPDTSVDPHVSRSSGPRTRSHSSTAGIKTYSTRRKSLATKKMSSSVVDLNAPDESFIQVLSNVASDDSDDASDPLFFWHVFAAWAVVPTGLGDVNALYFTDKSSKYFTHLREILHLLDRQDLSKLYGMVVKHYEVNPLAGTGLILWGDLHVLFESTTGGSSVKVWNDQQEWVIRSWKLFPFSGVHVLETFAGKILYMFADTPYPLSVSLMKKMLKHKLEVEIDGVGNDMTYAVQLIKFVKNQLASSVPSA